MPKKGNKKMTAGDVGENTVDYIGSRKQTNECTGQQMFRIMLLSAAGNDRGSFPLF